MACKDTVACLGCFLMLPHRFRWVYCQLEVLRQSLPSSVRGVLAELPESLDETYERILQQIPKPNRVHAHRLLQCLVVAARPLNVEELAEVLAIDFSATGMHPMVDKNLRWEDKERAVLSACSSLITTVQAGHSSSRLVQFSHFSVKEFLTSDRLAASTVDTLRYHHIRLEAAHTMMAQVCLSVFLQLEDHMDKRTIWSYSLSEYAGEHFGKHVEFENVISSISDGVDKLLDRDKPHFYTWVWLQIGDWRPYDWYNTKENWDAANCHHSWMDLYLDDSHSSEVDITQYHGTKPKHPPRLPPLYYVAALGNICLARHLILKCPQDLDVRDNKGCTPLHIAVLAREEEVSQLLIEHSINLDIRDINERTALHMVAYMGLTMATRMLLERGEPLKVGLNARDKDGRMPLHLASQRGRSGIARLLLKFGAEVDAQDNDATTPLLLVLKYRKVDYVSRITETAKLLLQHGASVHVRKKGRMPLHAASLRRLPDIVTLLLKFGADVDAQDNDTMTPLLLVSQLQPPTSGDHSEFTKTAQVLLEHGANVHTRNKKGRMPLHAASYRGLSGIVTLLLEFGADVDAQDNRNLTPLLLVSQSQPIYGGDTKAAQLLLEHGANIHVRNENGQMPLHMASHHGLSGIVALLLKFGADVDAQDNDTMTPLLLVSQARRCSSGDDSQITKTALLLLEHGASIHVRNKNGQMPLHTASHHGLSGIVALLLKFGADVDAQDNYTMTPLLFVSQARHCSSGNDPKITKTALLLLEHGASIHVRNKNGQMPLHIASQLGLSGIVELLLKFGADADARDIRNITPLHFAVSSPFQHGLFKSSLDDSPLIFSVIKTIKLLLEYGANLQMKNDKEQTPFQVALRRGEQDIIDVLSDYVQNDQAISR